MIRDGSEPLILDEIINVQEYGSYHGKVVVTRSPHSDREETPVEELDYEPDANKAPEKAPVHHELIGESQVDLQEMIDKLPAPPGTEKPEEMPKTPEVK